jgi:ribose transport system substrate-binding protein
MERSGAARYLIKSLVHAAQVVTAFRSEGEVLRLRDLVSRTGFNKMTCYRLVYTLHQCGFLEKVGENQYRPRFILRPRRKYILGYAAHGQNASFPRVVEAGLLQAAERAQFEVIVVNNRYDGKTALRNAERLARERLDLAIVFQADELVAPAVASKILDARIPLIAIDIPHPGATYFGADNYRAGVIAGHHLAHWANKHWEGRPDEIVFLEIARAGSVPQARVRGMFDGITEVIHAPGYGRVVRLDGDGMFGHSQEVVRTHLRTSKARRILLGAATDPSALGALRALEEAGRAANCAVAGQNADPEGRQELRSPGTRLIGSVAYFPEKYGEAVIRLALDILTGKPTPPAVFMKHQLITPENVDHIYPNDKLTGLDQVAGMFGSGPAARR